MSYLCRECGEWSEELDIDWDLDELVCPHCKSNDTVEKDRDVFLKEQALDRLIDERRGK